MLLTLARFRLTLYSPLIPVLGVDGPGDGVQGGLGVGDQEAAEAEQRQGEEAVGRQHQQARAQGAAGAAQGPQTSATGEIKYEELNLEQKKRSVGWDCGGSVLSFAFMPIMISCSSSQVFNLICRLSCSWK